VNVSLNWKRNRRPTDPWGEEELSASPAASPEAIVLLRLQLQGALSSLSPQRRAILLLRELEGCSVEEIGAAMGWNTKRVYNELFKARRAVAEWQTRSDAEGAGQ
jgi:DNA-directed RNA polymerase specialized sigma24 family protein